MSARVETTACLVPEAPQCKLGAFFVQSKANLMLRQEMCSCKIQNVFIVFVFFHVFLIKT